jgi:hypothetical protein
MGFLEDYRYKKQAKQDYKRCIESKEIDVKRFSKYANKEWENYEKIKTAIETGVFDEKYFASWNQAYINEVKQNPAKLIPTMEESRQKAMRWENLKKRTMQDMKYMRPNTKEDIAERQEMYANFAKKVASIDPHGVLDPRIHATTLATTEESLKSGGIISSVDRANGYMESTNLSNEISVGKIDEVQYSVNFWMDSSAYSESKPCGCMFFIQPQTQEEANMIHGRQMHNVYFNDHPEQLKAIVTTSENIGKVQQWCRESGVNVDVVHTFESFPQVMERMRDKWVPPYSDLTKIDIEQHINEKNVNLVALSNSRNYIAAEVKSAFREIGDKESKTIGKAWVPKHNHKIENSKDLIER